MESNECDSSTSFQRFSRRSRKKYSEIEENCDFQFSTHFLENHEQIIYGVEFCSTLKERQPIVFATCGSNRITIYECLNNRGIKILQCYLDPMGDEIFYTCSWSYDPLTAQPILAVAGRNRIIRIINPVTSASLKSFTGHGAAINDLKFSPKDATILLSASKDYSIRLWNIQSDVCIAIFGGFQGHRAEVLSVDFDIIGSRMVSCGMDNSLKVWCLDNTDVREAIHASYTYNRSNSSHTFKTILEHYPLFSTKDLHRNYVDCVKWMGNLIFSKSCENSIICWKPGPLGTDVADSAVSIIKNFEFDGGQLFFIRFSMDISKTYMAVGNTTGITHVWKLNADDPTLSIPLRHYLCTRTVRATAFSRNGKILICVCDDGTVWRWDRV